MFKYPISIISVLINISVISCKKEAEIANNPKPTLKEISGSKNHGEKTINLNQGLVAYYPFTGNANDASGNKNNGINHGALLTADRKGKRNSAYSFNGINNSIIVPHNDLLSLTNFTICSWIKIPNLSNDFYEILTKGGDLDENYEHVVYGNPVPPAGFVECAIKFTDGSRGYTFPVQNNFVKENQWSHIASSYEVSTGTLKTYVNGKLFQTGIVGANMTPIFNTTALYIGSDPYVGRYHEGMIDEIRIYNRALTQSEITYLSTH